MHVGGLVEPALTELFGLQDLLVEDKEQVLTLHPLLDLRLRLTRFPLCRIAPLEVDLNNFCLLSVPITVELQRLVYTLQDVHFSLDLILLDGI